MNDQNSVERRVLDFIADYADWNRDCFLRDEFDGGSMPSPCDYGSIGGDTPAVWPKNVTPDDRDPDYARRTLSQVSLRHCTEADTLARAGICHGIPSLHDPEDEMIAEIQVNGEQARVATRCSSGMIKNWEYSLVRRNTDWLIDRLRMFFSENDAERTPPDWDDLIFRDTFSVSDDVGLDFAEAFREGARSHNSESVHGEDTISVVSLGHIDVPSGRLMAVQAVEDPGEERPLEVMVDGTRLTVELARLGYHNAFVRVWLGPRKPVSAYVTARLAAQFGEEESPKAEPGTRSGAIVLADAEAWAGAPPREIERMSDLIFSEGKETNAQFEPARLVPVPGQEDVTAALINRGGGDFSCPCYWGLDATGAAVLLVIDLNIARQSIEERFELPYSPGWLGSDTSIAPFTEFGFDIFLSENANGVLTVRSLGAAPALDLIGAQGQVLGTTDRGGMIHSGDEHLQWIRCAHPPGPGCRLRLRWTHCRHGFARPQESTNHATLTDTGTRTLRVSTATPCFSFDAKTSDFSVCVPRNSTKTRPF